MKKPSVRQALLNAGLEILENGRRIEELSLRSIAESIGVSSGAPYRHFKDNRHYIAGLGVEGFSALINEMDTADSLEDLGKCYIDFAWRNPLLYEVMFYFPACELSQFPELATLAERAYELLKDAVEKHTGIRGIRLSVARASQAAWAYVHGLAGLGANGLLDFRPEDKQEILDELSTALTRGL